jgi:hypothetical protein
MVKEVYGLLNFPQGFNKIITIIIDHLIHLPNSVVEAYTWVKISNATKLECCLQSQE